MPLLFKQARNFADLLVAQIIEVTFTSSLVHVNNNERICSSHQRQDYGTHFNVLNKIRVFFNDIIHTLFQNLVNYIYL